MNKRFLILAFTGGVAMTGLHAEARKDGPPSAPLILQSRPAAAWKVAMAPPKTTAAPATTAPPKTESVPEPVAIKVDVFKGVRREILQWSDNTSSEKWYFKGMEYLGPTTSQSQPVIAPASSESSQFYGGYQDYPELSWIRPEAYVGREKVDKRDCFFFRDERAVVGVDPSYQKSSDFILGERKAWIDAETRLPVRAVLSGVTRDYIQLDPPNSLPPIPEKLKAHFAMLEERTRRANAYLP